MQGEIVYCDWMKCPKYDCHYHYGSSPWGEPFMMKKYRDKNGNCKMYKPEGKIDEVKQCD